MPHTAWRGDLAVGPFVVAVKVGGMIAGDKEKQGLKRLCEDCHVPFTRPRDECSECGKHPWSAAAEKRGDENLVPVCYGVPVEYGEDGGVEKWAVVDTAKLDDIKDATHLEDLELEQGDVVPIDDLPFHLVERSYYMWPDLPETTAKSRKKTVAKRMKRLRRFAMIHQLLEERGQAMVTLWTQRANMDPQLVFIHPVGPALVMNVLPYRAEVEEPEDEITDHVDAQIDPGELAMMEQLLDALSGPFTYSKYKDVTVEMRNRAIEEALAGKPITKVERAPVVDDDEDDEDLMGELERSLELVKGGKVGRRAKLAEESEAIAA